jgi:hypothetical protein
MFQRNVLPLSSESDTKPKRSRQQEEGALFNLEDGGNTFL